MAESTSDWIWEVDLKGVYTYSNHKVTELLGYEPEELIGKTPFDLMPMDEAKRVSGLFNNFISSQSSFNSIENVNIHKNGSRVVMETSAVTIFSNKGEFLGYRGIDRDITSRKHIEDDLRDNEAKLKALVENIPGMVYRASPDWSAEIINGSEAICGFTEKELTGKEKNWLNVIHNDDIIKIFENGSKLTHVKQNLVQRYRINTKEGGIRWVEDRKTSLFSEEGDFIGIDGIVFDITERKQMEEALKRSRETLEEKVKERTSELEDINIALKVLLKKGENDKKEMEEKISSNYKSLISPFIEKLKKRLTEKNQKNLMYIIESNMQKFFKHFSKKMSDQMSKLTPAEIQIASMIKEGLSNKEIAQILNNSVRTITNHRQHIRRKFDLENKKVNLRSYLSIL